MSKKEELDKLVSEMADRGNRLIELLDEQTMTGAAHRAIVGFVRETNQDAYQMRLVALAE